MPKDRLGVALLVPAPVADEVDGMRRALDDGALGRLPAHLTLVPPVNVRHDRLEDALAHLREAAANTRPFSLRLGPPATFLPDNPVIYLAVDGDLDALRALRDAVFVDPLERSLTWPFVPHVTLAEEASPDRITAALTALADYRADVTFDRVHLLREDAGRIWTPIADASFARGAVIGRGSLPLELTSSREADPEVRAFFEREWAAYEVDEYGEATLEVPFVIAARRDGVIVGVASAQMRDGETYLGSLIVAATHRGEGIGAHLLAAVEAHAAAQGCSRVTLRTQAGGPADAFYRSRGWTPYASLPRWRRGRDFVQLEKVL